MLFFIDKQHVCCNQLKHFNLFILVLLLINQMGALCKLYLTQQGHLYFHKYIPVQDLTPNSSSFTDADIIFNILLTSLINFSKD